MSKAALLTSPRKAAPKLKTVLIIGLFLSAVANPRIMGRGQNVKITLASQALIFGSFIFLLFAYVTAGNFYKVSRKDLPIFSLFFLFTGISSVSFIYGLGSDYSLFHTIGDFYKFVIPSILMTLLYLVMNSSDEMERILAQIYYLFVILFFIGLLAYFIDFLDPNQRISILYGLPGLIPLSFWLSGKGNRLARFSLPILLLATIPTLYYSQSLGLLIQLILVPGLTLSLFYGPKHLILSSWKKGLIGLFCLMLILGCIHNLNPTYLNELYTGYLGDKIKRILTSANLLQMAVEAGGSRIMEPLGIIEKMTNQSLFAFFFGAGMGSTFLTPAPGRQEKIWVGKDHHVHSGFWESFLRTGSFGAIIYLFISIMFFLVAWKVRKINIIGALAAAFAILNLVYLPIEGTNFLGVGFFNYFLLVYCLLLRRKSRKRLA